MAQPFGSGPDGNGAFVKQPQPAGAQLSKKLVSHGLPPPMHPRHSSSCSSDGRVDGRLQQDWDMYPILASGVPPCLDLADRVAFASCFGRNMRGLGPAVAGTTTTGKMRWTGTLTRPGDGGQWGHPLRSSLGGV